jgi:cytochrome c
LDNIAVFFKLNKEYQMKAVLGMAVAASLLVAGQAVAADESALAQKSGCLACHQVAIKVVGPAYKDVAKKYAGDKGAQARLASEVVKGTGPNGVGWMKAGQAALPFMPANVAVKPEDAAKLVQWVLSQK